MLDFLYEPFKCWSEKGSVWFISDTHFDDADCKFMDPDWISPAEQVKMVNRFVGKNDTLVHLGDVGDPKYIQYLKAGRKVLIKGNHDSLQKVASYFDEAYSGPLFISDKVLLSHEPIEGLPFCLNIHGHDHGGLDHGENHVNLAANVCGYIPVSLSQMVKRGELSQIKDIHRITIDKQIENSVLRENSLD